MSCLRIGIVGDCGVGKSALSMKIRSIGSMTETGSFDLTITSGNWHIICFIYIDISLLRGSHSYSPTIGCDIHIIECYCAPKNVTFTVEIFDMGGNPRFEKFVVSWILFLRLILE